MLTSSNTFEAHMQYLYRRCVQGLKSSMTESQCVIFYCTVLYPHTCQSWKIKHILTVIMILSLNDCENCSRFCSYDIKRVQQFLQQYNFLQLEVNLRLSTHEPVKHRM